MAQRTIRLIVSLKARTVKADPPPPLSFDPEDEVTWKIVVDAQEFNLNFRALSPFSAIKKDKNEIVTTVAKGDSGLFPGRFKCSVTDQQGELQWANGFGISAEGANIDVPPPPPGGH